MWDYDAGVFAKEFTAQPLSKLALLWLTQTGQTGLTLADMQGKNFVGLDNPGVTEYFCSITSGYAGFRRNMRTRGAGDKGVVGDRQKRRHQTSLNDEFVMLLRKACPPDLSQAFSVLQGTNSFKDFFRDSSQTLENNNTVKALVTSYDSAAMPLEKSFVLSLFSTFNTRAATMKTFKCTEHAVKTAILLARLRRLTIIKKTDASTFGRFAKETVAHMESWALSQDVVRRAAFSDRVRIAALARSPCHASASLTSPHVSVSAPLVDPCCVPRRCCARGRASWRAGCPACPCSSSKAPSRSVRKVPPPLLRARTHALTDDARTARSLHG